MPDLIDGRYRLLEVLASGGMATVWRAEDTRLGRLVALKRPHPAPPDDPTHARIEREARAAASLNHPHLVTIYDVGRDENGPFLVMELVEGPTLAEVGRDMERSQAVEVVARVADALAIVHAAGIVHRDIKPANVLMSTRGPQLTDFGIAVTGDATSRLTQDGALVATPTYAAPEQLAGEAATARSDIYSLGVVLYELLTGRLPSVGPEHHQPPSVGDAHLDAVLARVLAADPQLRPDARELAGSLRSSAPTVTAAAAGNSGSTMQMPIPAAPPPSDSWDASSRRPLVLAGVTIGALILAGALFALPDGGGPATGSTPPPETTAAPPSTTATTAAPTTTLATTTTVETTTTTSDVADSVEEARDDLEAALASAHPSDMNPPEVQHLLDKADEAIALVEEGKDDEAGRKLREVARHIDDKLEGDVRHRSLESLVDLADALDVSLEPDRGRDDGDDDDD